MDPLSLTASILGITTTCLKTAHLLDGLREKYKHAQMTISALCAEATVISASLSQIQSIILQNPGAIISQLRPKSEIIATFDAALTGCSVVFAVLDEEIAALIMEGQEGDLSWAQRARLVWKDGVMKDLLQQLRGQSTTIGLLMQALQIESIAGIKELLQQNSLVLEHVMRQTRSLRDTHPQVIAPRSIFDSQREEIGSMIGTEQTELSDATFAFDDLLVNSKVYRRVLAQARSKISLNEEKQEILEQGAEESKPIPKEDLNEWEVSLRRFHSTALLGTGESVPLSEIDQDFKDELSAIAQWFKVLSADERVHSLYRLAGILLDKEVEKSGYLGTADKEDPENIDEERSNKVNKGDPEERAEERLDKMRKSIIWILLLSYASIVEPRIRDMAGCEVVGVVARPGISRTYHLWYLPLRS